jgi:hypothetical protein
MGLAEKVIGAFRVWSGTGIDERSVNSFSYNVGNYHDNSRYE